jgi:hypothetical protein
LWRAQPEPEKEQVKTTDPQKIAAFMQGAGMNTPQKE